MNELLILCDYNLNTRSHGVLGFWGPREAFNFAQQIRTEKHPNLVERFTEQLLNTLGLSDCADVQLDSGLRNSQRKLVSIGYEMVTEPSLLLLDEPTSGLDSL